MLQAESEGIILVNGGSEREMDHHKAPFNGQRQPSNVQNSHIALCQWLAIAGPGSHTRETSGEVASCSVRPAYSIYSGLRHRLTLLRTPEPDSDSACTVLFHDMANSHLHDLVKRKVIGTIELHRILVISRQQENEQLSMSDLNTDALITLVSARVACVSKIRPMMPAEAPEVGDRGGCPRARGEYGPIRDGLPQEQAADEGRDMVHRVDGCIHDDAAVEHGECQDEM